MTTLVAPLLALVAMAQSDSVRVEPASGIAGHFGIWKIVVLAQHHVGPILLLGAAGRDDHRRGATNPETAGSGQPDCPWHAARPISEPRTCRDAQQALPFVLSGRARGHRVTHLGPGEKIEEHRNRRLSEQHPRQTPHRTQRKNESHSSFTTRQIPRPRAAANLTVRGTPLAQFQIAIGPASGIISGPSSGIPPGGALRGSAAVCGSARRTAAAERQGRRGATLIVAAPKHQGGSGGPARVFAVSAERGARRVWDRFPR